MDPEPRRYQLQRLLEEILETDDDGSAANVHFQPPTGTEMAFPAITYSRGRAVTEFADNKPYRRAQSYTVTVIHHDPDNAVRDLIAALPYCEFDRWYANDGLNHDVYNLFF
jgi:hypothetical protein